MNPAPTIALLRFRILLMMQISNTLENLGFDRSFLEHMTPEQLDGFDIARVIADVWLSNLVAWVTRRASAKDVVNQLELATRLLLR